MSDDEDIPLALRRQQHVEYAPPPKPLEQTKKVSKENRRNVDRKAQSRVHVDVDQIIASKERKRQHQSRSSISELRAFYHKQIHPWLGAIAFGFLAVLFIYLRIREEFYDHEKALAQMQETDDPFQVLQVSRDASLNDIRASYMELSKQLHPDKNKNCTDCATRLEQVRLAYNKLSDPKKREQILQGNTAGTAPGEKEDSPIPSETFTLTDTNFDWEVQKQDAWLIQVYTDWSSACWEVMSDWEKTYNEIGKYIPMGRINTAKESELSRRFSIYKVPTFISYVNGKHTVFNGRPNPSNFTAFMLNSMRDSVWRITDANYRIFLNENEDKVRVLLFANRDLAKLRLVFRSLARQYKNSMVLGEVSALDSPGLYQLYNATKEKPSLLFIKEKGVKPLRYNGQMTYTKLKSLFDEHKFQVVPRLSTVNVDDLCARPDNTSCVIFFRDAAAEASRDSIMAALRNASRTAADATVDEETGAVESQPFFVWTDVSKQQQLASLLNVTAGGDRVIVALDKNNMKALAYPGNVSDSSEILLWAQTLKEDEEQFRPLSGALYLTYEAPPINFRQIWRTVSPYITMVLVVTVIVLLWYAASTYYQDIKEQRLAESRARRISKNKASIQKDVKAEKWRAIEEENRKAEERRQRERAEQERIERERREQENRRLREAAAAAGGAGASSPDTHAKLNPAAPAFKPPAAAAAEKQPKEKKEKKEEAPKPPKEKKEKKQTPAAPAPAPAAAAAAPAAPVAVPPPTDGQLRNAIDKIVRGSDLSKTTRRTVRDALSLTFPGADLSSRHTWIGAEIDAAVARLS